MSSVSVTLTDKTLLKKEQIENFSQLPEIKTWLDGSGLKPSTRDYYTKRLFEFLDGEQPKQFLERALKNPREISIETKTKIGKLVQASASTAVHTRVALKSFLEFYETNIHLNGKLKLRRRWSKPFLSWADAEKIIAKCREPYESIFRFMLWSGVGQDEVMEINSSKEIQESIQKQLVDQKKDYVVIDLEPRKQTLNRYFVAVPKQYPLRTFDYRIRGGKLIHTQVMENIFRGRAKEVGVYEKGMGPHTLRSVFTSQCAMVGVREAVCEFMKGHGSGDKYGYSREVLNEEYVVKELRKLWEPATVSKEEVDQLKNQMQAQITQLQGQYETLLKLGKFSGR
jgi:hypothetical protein